MRSGEQRQMLGDMGACGLGRADKVVLDSGGQMGNLEGAPLVYTKGRKRMREKTSSPRRGDVRSKTWRLIPRVVRGPPWPR